MLDPEDSSSVGRKVVDMGDIERYHPCQSCRYNKLSLIIFSCAGNSNSNSKTMNTEHSNLNPELESEWERLEEKWGEEILSAGWTAVPNKLLRRQKNLGIDSVELNVLLNLIRFWWRRADAPFPSPGKIADEIGISPRTVHRKLKDMEGKGLLTREKSEHGRTRYSLGGLVELLRAD